MLSTFKTISKYAFIFLYITNNFSPLYSQEAQEEIQSNQLDDNLSDQLEQQVIKSITIEGNNLVPVNAIRAKVIYAEGELFDPVLSRQVINNILSLGYFSYVEIQIEELSPQEIAVYIIVQEKPKIEIICYENNVHLKAEEIEKKLSLSNIPSMDDADIAYYAEKIKLLYAEKSYHNAQVTGTLIYTGPSTAKVVFTINEGNISIVKRVFFKGNCAFTSKQLRSMIFHREDWILGFIDKSGTYQPEMLEGDKFILENFYQSHGFLAARVTDINVERDPCNPCLIQITYTIEEGDIYTVKCVSAPGNDILTEQQLLSAIPIAPGQLYSKELIRRSLEALRTIWGQYGYIYADVSPAIIPDEVCKTVEITFHSELGNKVYLRRLLITGNCKTRDYVIRRRITLTEGDLLTTPAMDISKANVERLGFFEARQGVNWNTTRIDDTLADLELVVQEAKTGNLFAQLGYGGSETDTKSPNTSFKISAGIGDRNFLGTGLSYNLALSYSKDDRSAIVSFTNPWLFERPILGGIDVYHRRSTYEEFNNIRPPQERVTGVTGLLGFSQFLGYLNTNAVFNAATEHISYGTNAIIVQNLGKTPEETFDLNAYYNRQFQNGNYTWLAGSISEDLRNHPIFPTFGYQWNMNSKIGLPSFGPYAFAKIEADATWITPLIGQDLLLFFLHGHIGFVRPLQQKVIPYRELFHVGGPATVRGFTFGQISPQLFGDPIGGENAFWVNAELIFNITDTMGLKGVVFYDGGASWRAPNLRSNLLENSIRNNQFHYRHAVGFGFRVLYQGTPVKVDWGFKLDRIKKLGESVSEVHFSMSRDF